MAYVVSDPEALLEETGIDFRKVGVLTHTLLDSARSIRPLLVVHGDQRYLVAHSVDKAAIGFAQPRNVQPIYYGGWFTFDDVVLGSTDQKSIEGALYRALRGETAVDVTPDISVTYFRHLARLVRATLKPPGSGHELFVYAIPRESVLERFGSAQHSAAEAALRVFQGSRACQSISRYLDERIDLRFPGLSEAMWESGVDAFLLSSATAVQDASGVAFDECRRTRALAIVRHGGPVYLLCRQKLEALEPVERLRDFPAAAARYLPPGVIGIEPDDLDMASFLGLGLENRQVQFATQAIRAWRERRAIDELSFYAILARAQVFAIEGALEGVKGRLGSGDPVRETDIESRYWEAVKAFARRYDLPFTLEEYFTAIFTSDHVFPAPPAARLVPAHTKTIRFDAALLAVDSLGLVHANSDSSRHLTFDAPGDELAREFEHLARDVVMPRVRPGITGEDVWRMGVQHLESSQARWERLGVMPLGSPPLSSVFLRDTGHMFAKQTRPAILHTKGNLVPARAGMVGTIEYVWAYNGYSFGLEDTYFVGPSATICLSVDDRQG